MITNIDLTKLRNAEYLRFMSEAVGMMHGYRPDELQCDAELGTLSISLAELEIIHRNDPEFGAGGELSGLDAARDRLITGLVKYCDAHTYGPDPEKRAAADLLSRSLAAYGADIAHKSYEAESATITSLLAEWSTKPELIAAVTRIDAEEWTSALSEANERFKAVYQQRQRVSGEGPAPADTLQTKRDETDAAWYQLRERLNSFFVGNQGAAPWSTVVARLNALIDERGPYSAGRAGRIQPSNDRPLV